MKFLIQTIQGEVRHDFSFTLLESIRYHKFLGNDIEYILSDHPDTEGCIPIGSVEFVTEYLKVYHNKTPKPINIPEQLFIYAGREILNGTEKDIIETKFVKSNDKIKSFTEICDTAPEGRYQISDVIEIDSEWRVFVHKGVITGLNNYSGDFCMFPDIDTIKNMVSDFKTAPVAYTLDVGISGDRTVIIEVHDFFSCGLYGFTDHKKLPFMFSQWFYEFIRV